MWEEQKSEPLASAAREPHFRSSTLRRHTLYLFNHTDHGKILSIC